ncbi:MAG: hypothetical protein R2845_04955 [Thermomicrobiales bacterium]
MDAHTETHRSSGGSADVEAVRIGKRGWIAIRGREHRGHAGAGLDRVTGDLHRL